VIDPSPPALFDAHLHVIDPRYPLATNEGYLPPTFTAQDYRHRTEHLNVVGGAVVSGSFHAFDQSSPGPRRHGDARQRPRVLPKLTAHPLHDSDSETLHPRVRFDDRSTGRSRTHFGGRERPAWAVLVDRLGSESGKAALTRTRLGWWPKSSSGTPDAPQRTKMCVRSSQP